MRFWDFNLNFGDFIFDIATLNMLLVIGFFCRWWIPFFQRYLIPSSLIAGFLGLILGPELLGMLGFTTERMGLYLYHLLALLFICIGLQKSESEQSRGALHIGFLFTTSYLIQILVGVGVMLIISAYFIPGQIPAIGMLLPLGFGMGPGIANSIGATWEADFGVDGAGSIGLSISAVGFLIAYFVGMTIVNRGIRLKKSTLLEGTQSLTPSILTGVIRETPLSAAGHLKFHGSSIEPFTFHVGLVGLLYFATYWVTQGLATFLEWQGVSELVSVLWGLHFLVGNLLALATSHLLKAFKASYLVDSGITRRITGLFTDYMIAAAIMAISLSVAWNYAGSILAMCLLGALVTWFVLRYLVYRVFSDYPFERFTSVFGEMTGTIASGLALLRVSDPEFKTPIAQDLGLGSGFAFILGFPLLLIINLPFVYFNGEMMGYWVVMGGSALYLLLILLIWKLFGLRWHKKS